MVIWSWIWLKNVFNFTLNNVKGKIYSHRTNNMHSMWSFLSKIHKKKKKRFLLKSLVCTSAYLINSICSWIKDDTEIRLSSWAAQLPHLIIDFFPHSLGSYKPYLPHGAKSAFYNVTDNTTRTPGHVLEIHFHHNWELPETCSIMLVVK